MSVLDKEGGWEDNQAVPDARPLILALALEAAPMGAVRLMRSSWQKSAYVATLVVAPDRDTAGQVESGEFQVRTSPFPLSPLPGTVPWDSSARVAPGGN